MSKIKLFSLGGLDENGKNMFIIEVDKEIFVWTVNSKKQIKRFISLDINIITDKSYII